MKLVSNALKVTAVKFLVNSTKNVRHLICKISFAILTLKTLDKCRVLFLILIFML